MHPRNAWRGYLTLRRGHPNLIVVHIHFCWFNERHSWYSRRRCQCRRLVVIRNMSFCISINWHQRSISRLKAGLDYVQSPCLSDRCGTWYRYSEMKRRPCSKIILSLHRPLLNFHLRETLMVIAKLLEQKKNGRGQLLDVNVDNFLWKKLVAAIAKGVVHFANYLYFAATQLLPGVSENLTYLVTYLCLVRSRQTGSAQPQPST